jgi:hypothetical protein
MSRLLLCRIQNAVDAHDIYFVQRRDNSKRLGFLPFRRLLRHLLACGVTTNFMDEYLKIGKPTVIESLKIFVKVVSLIF